ncbi:hypothetical protein [Pectobacterium sp. CHL-2024]|uniref:hypothetical protein n=1 Tax=Pectobacterium sp. CHL-2024 TaxID=3377079 RepID=UPI00380435CD
MHSLKREKLYEAQLNQATALRNGSHTQQLDNEIYLAELAIVPDRNEKLIEEISVVAEMVKPLKLSADFITLITSALAYNLGNTLTDAEFETSRRMVEGLFKVDLRDVKWFPLEIKSRDYVEGTCHPVGDSAHFIYTQHDKHGVLSTDLLVHEMGHAADYTLSRLVNDDTLLVRHISLAETLAFYCQYKYLSEYGSQILRRGSIGAFIYTYLCIATMRYCLKNSISLQEMDVDIALDDVEFESLIKSYESRDLDGRDFLSRTLKDRVKSYENIQLMIHFEISPRLGIVLSILLLKKSPDVLKYISIENRINTDLQNIVHKHLPDYYDVISDFETMAINYINGK